MFHASDCVLALKDKIVLGVFLVILISLNSTSADINRGSPNALPFPHVRDEIIITSTDEAIRENLTSTTNAPVVLNPSTWTPVIVLALFIAAVITVGAPTIIANHLKENEAKKIIPKRRYTLSLTLVDPNEINGFTRM